ncbi:hypothetical protein ACF0H5_002537 [Mactra antiquata]
MSSTNLTFRFIAILCVLTVLNMMFFGLTWHKKINYHPCVVDNVIEGVVRYIQNNGAHRLEHHMPESCARFDNAENMKETFNTALKNLLDICESRKIKINQASYKHSPLITLFTSWSPDSSKDPIHNNTLRNWASLQPEVKIVVFTNNTEDTNLAKSYGAHVMPILRHGGGGAPVLKWMFQSVMKQFNNCQLYGYVNSDILFTPSLVKSLKKVVLDKDMTKPLFLVGRRINVLNVSRNETDNYHLLEKVAKQRGELFGANAEDFFITNSAFPWSSIVDVVVGRLAYDNWLVGHVICKMKIDVIDLTNTVLAVHQTTKKGGNFEGFKNKDAHFNNALFKQLKIIPIFETGFTICSQELTYNTLCEDIEITKRETFWEKCKCPATVLF